MTSSVVVFLVLGAAASVTPGEAAPAEDAGPASAAQDAVVEQTPADDAPDDDAPDDDAPDDDAPDDGAPGNDAPGNDAPENDAPENDAPENDAPDGDAPTDEGLPTAPAEQPTAPVVSAEERAATEALLADDGLTPAEEEERPSSPTQSNPSATAAPDPPETEKSGPVQWNDADARLPRFARGALGACETIIFPVTFLPVIGELATAVSEWFCLVPAALTVDYLGVFHGGRGTSFWQPLIALFAAKLWRDAALIAGFAVGITAALAFSTVFGAASVLVLLSPDVIASGGAAFLPTIGLTGLLTVIGASIVVTGWAQDTGGEFIFERTYLSLTEDLTEPGEVMAARERAFLRPPPDPWSRGYALLVATVAAEPAGNWLHAIPVAGPLFRAGAMAETVEGDLRAFGRDVLHEEPQHPAALTELARITSYLEGGLEAGGQAMLVLGGASFVAGLIAAPIVFSRSGDAGQYAIVGAGLGTTGLVMAGGGLFLLLVAEIPRATRNVAMPLAFGALPPVDLDAE